MNEPVLKWSIQVQPFHSEKHFYGRDFLSASGIYERRETLNFPHASLTLNTEQK